MLIIRFFTYLSQDSLQEQYLEYGLVIIPATYLPGLMWSSNKVSLKP